jgi:DNA-binding NtrC family response regulator
LRERPDDVPWLAETLWADAAKRVGTKATLAPELISALGRYDWPGNVRELQNVIAALAVHAPPRGRVASSLLPAHLAQIAGRSPRSFDEARLDFERRFVRAALAHAGGRKAAAARQLGMSRQGLAKMMKRLGLAPI